jgi:hypothetical protein
LDYAEQIRPTPTAFNRGCPILAGLVFARAGLLTQTSSIPGAAANSCDQIAAYPSELCAASLPAGVVVHEGEQRRIAIPITKAKSVTLRSVFRGPQSTPGNRRQRTRTAFPSCVMQSAHGSHCQKYGDSRRNSCPSRNTSAHPNTFRLPRRRRNTRRLSGRISHRLPRIRRRRSRRHPSFAAHFRKEFMFASRCATN